MEMGLQFEIFKGWDTRGPASSMLSSEVSVFFWGGWGELEGKWAKTRLWALQAKLSPLGTKTNGVIFHASVFL